MTNRQVSSYKMALAIYEFITTNKGKIETIPFFDTLVTTLDSSLKNIRKIEENRFVLNATKSIAKNELKQKLLELAYIIATKCVLYFNYTNNQTKKAEVNFTITKLKRARDIDFAAKCTVIFNVSNEFLPELVHYNINKEAILELKSIIDEYTETISNNRLSKVAKTSLVKQGKDTFATISNTLAQMDLVFELMRMKNKQLYLDYKKQRKLDSMPTYSQALRITITSKQTNQAVALALVQLTPENTEANDRKIRAKKTSPKGTVIYKRLKNGIYTLTISKIGYKDISYSLRIEKEEPLRLNLQMEENQG